MYEHTDPQLKCLVMQAYRENRYFILYNCITTQLSWENVDLKNTVTKVSPKIPYLNSQRTVKLHADKPKEVNEYSCLNVPKGFCPQGTNVSMGNMVRSRLSWYPAAWLAVLRQIFSKISFAPCNHHFLVIHHSH